MEPAGIVLILLIVIGIVLLIGLFWVLALGVMTARAALEYFDRENARSRQRGAE